MSLDWIDVSQLSFNSLLLLEGVQLSWLPDWPWELRDQWQSLCTLTRNRWYMRHKSQSTPGSIRSWRWRLRCRSRMRQAGAVMGMIEDLVLRCQPGAYDAQPFGLG
jgi:hypothetical protein